MENKETTKLSKFLSLILRHKPEEIGLTLDDEGWAGTRELLEKIQFSGNPVTMDDLRHVVRTSDKKRFVFSEDETRIRANQGHSIKVDLNLEPQTPPDMLYHGTATKNVESIKSSGLLKKNRHHVHLSSDTITARKVGMRYGKPIVLEIHAGEMARNGHFFYISENGVWLTEHVPSKYINFEALE